VTARRDAGRLRVRRGVEVADELRRLSPAATPVLDEDG
jgi:hypothetical protein